MSDFWYEDMDPDFRSKLFLARKKLLGGVESPTILPDHGLNARGLLNEAQLATVEKIRKRRLATVMEGFTRD